MLWSERKKRNSLGVNFRLPGLRGQGWSGLFTRRLSLIPGLSLFGWRILSHLLPSAPFKAFLKTAINIRPRWDIVEDARLDEWMVACVCGTQSVEREVKNHAGTKEGGILIRFCAVFCVFSWRNRVNTGKGWMREKKSRFARQAVESIGWIWESSRNRFMNTAIWLFLY